MEAGDADGITDETMRLIDDTIARHSLELLDAVRDRGSADRSCTGAGPTLEALRMGRVEHLLVVDDVEDDRRTTLELESGAVEGRLVDVAIRQALVTDAEMRIVPGMADIADGLGALLRW